MTQEYACTAERFRSNIEEHRMSIEMDQGVHRSIYFGKPGSISYHFRLVTYPGGLLINGDCGSYSFSRLTDMFEFFRDPDMQGFINPSYWHGKTNAQDKHGKSEEFSADLFNQCVKEEYEHWEGAFGTAKEVWEELEYDVLDPDSEEEAYHRIVSFQSKHGHEFVDFFDRNLKEYTFRFIWCLRAIVWGIKQYHLVKQGRTQADHDRRVLAGEL